MSVVGEVLAVVSCIAGLIQAYDAAGRSIERIKERRRVHKAAPPSEYLAKSVERGKRQLEEAIEEGKERFGEEFDKADVAVQMALMRITIDIQNELLNNLSNARADDDFVDFSDCINASDNGRKEALNVLNEYFLRKSKEEKEAAARQRQIITIKAAPQPRETEARQASQPVLSISPPAVQPVIQQFSPPPEQTRSRKFSWIRRSSTTIEAPPQARAQPNHSPITRQSTFPNSPVARTASGNIQTPSGIPGNGPDCPSSDPRRSLTNANRTAPQSPASPVSSLRPSLSRRNTTQSDLSSASTAVQTSDGGCKNAHRIREGQVSKSIKLQILTTYAPGATTFNYRCTSTKCAFQVAAIKNKKGDWTMDNRVRNWRGILEYRPIFLAKSHMPMQVAWKEQGTKGQYICIICMLSHESTRLYLGHDALLDHVAGHMGASWRGVKLEGPLAFNNNGASSIGDFDINLLEPLPGTEVSSISTRDGALVLDPELQRELDKLDLNSRRSSYTTMEIETDPYFSPW